MINQAQDSLNVISQSNSEFDYVNLLFGFFGIVGTVVTVYSLYLYRKSRTENAFIFKTVQTAINKEKTEADLELAKKKIKQKEEEFSTIKNDILLLQEKIRKEIPREAKRAVLLDKLEESKEHLRTAYKEVTHTKEKLSKLGEDSEIPEELARAIQSEIEPRYLIREKLSGQKTSLTIFSSIAAVASALVPGVIGNYIGLIIMFFSIPLIYKIYKNNILADGADRQELKLKLANVRIFGILILCFALGVLGLILGTTMDDPIFTNSRYSGEQEFLLLFGFFLTVGSIVGAFFRRRVLRKRKKQLIE